MALGLSEVISWRNIQNIVVFSQRKKKVKITFDNDLCSLTFF